MAGQKVNLTNPSKPQPDFERVHSSSGSSFKSINLHKSTSKKSTFSAIEMDNKTLNKSSSEKALDKHLVKAPAKTSKHMERPGSIRRFFSKDK